MSHAVALPVRTAARPSARAWSAVVALLATLTLVLAASPALAHDTLISSDPEEGATLEEAPTEAVLTFSAELTASGAIAVLQDADGTETELEEPTYDGRDAIWELPELDGEQTLVWSVISSDGHRIEGEIPFTVDAADATGGETPSEDDAAATDETTTDDAAGGSGEGDTGAEEGSEEGTADDGAAPGQESGSDTAAQDEGPTSDPADEDTTVDAAAATEEDDDSGWGATPWIGAALVLVAGAVVWFAMRGRSTPGEQPED